MTFSFDLNNLRANKAIPPYHLSATTPIWNNYLEYFNSTPHSETDTEDFMSLKPIFENYSFWNPEINLPVEIWGEQKLLNPEMVGELVCCLIDAGKLNSKQIYDCIRFGFLFSGQHPYPTAHVDWMFTNHKVYLSIIQSLIEFGHESTARCRAESFLRGMELSYFSKLNQDEAEARIDGLIEIIGFAKTSFRIFEKGYTSTLFNIDLHVKDKTLKEKLLSAVITHLKKDEHFVIQHYMGKNLEKESNKDFLKFLIREGYLFDYYRHKNLKALSSQLKMYLPHELAHFGISIRA